MLHVSLFLRLNGIPFLLIVLWIDLGLIAYLDSCKQCCYDCGSANVSLSS